MSRFKGQPALTLLLLLGIGILGIIWLVSFIPGVGTMRLGTDNFIDSDFMTKEKSAVMCSIMSETGDGVQGAELFGRAMAGEAIDDEKELASLLSKAGVGYIALVGSDGEIVWESGTPGEQQFEADVPLPGGLGSRGRVRLG